MDNNTPITRIECYLQAILEHGGGGSSVEVKSLEVTENGEYSEEGVAYSPVTVNVPNSYTQSDEGKVVSNGALVSQTAHNTVTENGTIDTTLNNSVAVDVPNSYSAGDEGKVVSNGALVAQTSDSVTQNGTVDTTLINSLLVNVSGGGGGSNVILGSFEGVEAGVLSVDTGYSGNGYPIALYIWITDGPYNTNGAGYATGLSYVPFLYYIVKMLPSEAPTWTGFDDENNGLTNMVYRASGTAVSQGSLSNSTKYMATGTPSDYNEKSVVVINDASHFKVVVKARNNSGYGFPVGVNYKYCAVYSE